MKKQSAPKQARAKETYEALLSASQEVLAEVGIEGFNSNAIVERVGMTPPAFYRYFPNKHSVLAELGKRLMDAQNEILIGFETDGLVTREEFVAESIHILKETLEITRSFSGGYALLVSLRAIPELKPVRLESHDEMARVLARQLKRQGVAGRSSTIVSKARLAIEIGYGTVEMLFDTDFKDEKIVLASAADGMAAVVGM